MAERMRIETGFDHEGAWARLYDGDSTDAVASAYEYATKHETWIEVRDAAVAELKKKSATFIRLGPAPGDSTILVSRNELETIAAGSDV